MKKTKYYSYSNKGLVKGCSLCVKGRKLVLFITGLCSKRCAYCPISEQKKNKDVIFANEVPVSSDKDILNEVIACSAKGAGITGGDPLVKLDRVVHCIRLLKKTFGKKFHIHLYTPLELVSLEVLKKLYNSGLDEIRFHPDIDNNKLWTRVKLAKKFKWSVGMEIPVIPGKKKETSKLIKFIKNDVDFINLNELEFSDTNAFNLKGFKPKNELSYAAKGSQELSLDLMKQFSSTRIHYCTCTLKDKVQMGTRLKLRAKNVALPTDKVTKEGMLTRGVIYLNKPSFGYHRKLTSEKIKKELKGLVELKRKIEKDFNVKLALDKVKPRLLTSVSIVRKISKKMPNCAIVTEYPTYDGMELEIEFLEKN